MLSPRRKIVTTFGIQYMYKKQNCHKYRKTSFRHEYILNYPPPHKKTKLIIHIRIKNLSKLGSYKKRDPPLSVGGSLAVEPKILVHRNCVKDGGLQRDCRMRFSSLFLGCMDLSRPEREPLVVLNLNNAPLILDTYLKF